MTTLKASLNVSRENCERLKNEQGALQNAFLSEQNSISDVETEMQKMYYERDRAIDDVRTLSVKVETLEQQLAVAVNERNSMSQRLKDSVASASHFRDECLAMERDAKSNGSKMANCKLEIAGKNKQIEELKRGKEALEDELKAVNRKLREKEEDHYQLLHAREQNLVQAQQVFLASVSPLSPQNTI